MIKMHPVISSNVEAAGYDEETRTLRIKFVSGATYEYAGISKTTYEGIFKAHSAGRYVREVIASGRYKSKKV